jgi:hypothetical protein
VESSNRQNDNRFFTLFFLKRKRTEEEEKEEDEKEEEEKEEEEKEEEEKEEEEKEEEEKVEEEKERLERKKDWRDGKGKIYLFTLPFLSFLQRKG